MKWTSKRRNVDVEIWVQTSWDYSPRCTIFLNITTSSAEIYTDYLPPFWFHFSLGEKRGSNVEAYNEILDEVELSTLNQVLEVSIFNDFPEPLVTSKWRMTEDDGDYVSKMAVTLWFALWIPHNPILYTSENPNCCPSSTQQIDFRPNYIVVLTPICPCVCSVPVLSVW